MQIKFLCLGQAYGPAAEAALRSAAQALLRETSVVFQVQHLRVLRHIPTDSVPEDRTHAGVTAEADAIQAVLQLGFENVPDAQACVRSAAWATFREQVSGVAPVLFQLDAISNVPIPPKGAAVRGGFRRWMLLARKAQTQEQFRSAWFGRHADLVKQLPHIDGYFQHLVTARHDALSQLVGYDRMPIDGIAEICFADEAAMNASYTSPARLPLRDDGRELLGRINTMLVEAQSWT